MTDNTPHTTGETLEQLLERVTFSDPGTHRLRDEWEEAKRTEQAVFERVCKEEYERRLEYHQICQTPDPEGVAQREVNLLRPVFHDEMEGRLFVLWMDIVRQVNAVLTKKSGNAQGASPPDGTDEPEGTGGSGAN